mgnify:CR=1 FL=1
MFSKKTIANILSIALFSNIVINNFSINEVLANVKKVKIEGNILGKLGAFEINQIFKNETKECLEVEYTFPMIETATIVKFEAKINEKILKGICKEKEEGGLSAWCSEVYMVEGEIYLKIELDSEEDDTVGDIYCCYDPAAKRFKEIKKNDEEMFYCMLD